MYVMYPHPSSTKWAHVHLPTITRSEPTGANVRQEWSLFQMLLYANDAHIRFTFSTAFLHCILLSCISIRLFHTLSSVSAPFCSFSLQFSVVSCIRKQIDNGLLMFPLSICFLIQETTETCNENEQKGPETEERMWNNLILMQDDKKPCRKVTENVKHMRASLAYNSSWKSDHSCLTFAPVGLLQVIVGRWTCARFVKEGWSILRTFTSSLCHQPFGV